MMIAEVRGKFDVSPYTLRYYERTGLIPPVNRSKNEIRYYFESNLEATHIKGNKMNEECIPWNHLWNRQRRKSFVKFKII